MPQKRTQQAILKKMESKVKGLESEISEVRSAHAAVENVVKENHVSLIVTLGSV